MIEYFKRHLHPLDLQSQHRLDPPPSESMWARTPVDRLLMLCYFTQSFLRLYLSARYARIFSNIFSSTRRTNLSPLCPTANRLGSDCSPKLPLSSHSQTAGAYENNMFTENPPRLPDWWTIDRLDFVSEGEASVKFCLFQSNKLESNLKVWSTILLVRRSC
jgi:hypothetical protein